VALRGEVKNFEGCQVGILKKWLAAKLIVYGVAMGWLRLVGSLKF